MGGNTSNFLTGFQNGSNIISLPFYGHICPLSQPYTLYRQGQYFIWRFFDVGNPRILLAIRCVKPLLRIPERCQPLMGDCAAHCYDTTGNTDGQPEKIMVAKFVDHGLSKIVIAQRHVLFSRWKIRHHL